MDEKQLIEGIKNLDELSRGDYHEPLTAILDEGPGTEGAARLGRLIGVSLKQPFAEVQDLLMPSHYSRSYRGWELNVKTFDDPRVAETWQYKTLEALRQDLAGEQKFDSILTLAQEAHYERGFFGYLARSVQKCICGDPKLRRKIDKHVREGRAAGFNVKVFTPEQLVQGSGLAIGTLLIGHVPVLSMVGAPVIAGFVLLFYCIGADAFCAWAKDLNADRERL